MLVLHFMTLVVRKRFGGRALDSQDEALHLLLVSSRLATGLLAPAPVQRAGHSDFVPWPFSTGRILRAGRRNRSIADTGRISAHNDL